MKRKAQNFNVGDLVQMSYCGKKTLGSRNVNKYKGVGIVLKKQDDWVYTVHWLGDDPHITGFHQDFIELVDKRTISDRLT